MTFGEKLQKLRAREGISQDRLAELLDVSRQAVSRWERDETMPETEKVVQIAEIFGVTTDYLLRQQAEEKPRPHAAVEPKKDWIDKLAYIAKTKGYLAGWVLIAWGALDLLGVLWMVLMALGIGVGSLFW